MPSWLIPVLVFALSLVFLLLRLPTRSRRSERLRARAVNGRAVRLPALGGPAGAERRGRVRDDGDALVFWSGRRQPLRLPRGLPADQARRLVVKEDEADVGEVYVFESHEGARFAIGVVEGYEDAFGALRTTPQRTVPATTRIRLAFPTWTRWMAGLALLTAGAVHWVVWTGRSLEAQVTLVVVSSEDVTGHLCSVQWLDGGTEQSATVGCDPAPVSGDRMGIRALGWPLHVSAMDPTAPTRSSGSVCQSSPSS